MIQESPTSADWGSGVEARADIGYCGPARSARRTEAPMRESQGRIAPRLGRLTWVRGSVPTPHGHIKVEVNDDRVIIDSRVPVELDIEGQPSRTLKPGRYETARSA